jgi:hypothetical protein
VQVRQGAVCSKVLAMRWFKQLARHATCPEAPKSAALHSYSHMQCAPCCCAAQPAGPPPTCKSTSQNTSAPVMSLWNTVDTLPSTSLLASEPSNAPELLLGLLRATLEPLRKYCNSARFRKPRGSGESVQPDQLMRT